MRQAKTAIVNSKDDHDQTPPSPSARNEYEGLVSILVAQDYIGIKSKDEKGQRQPLSAAIYGHKEVVMQRVGKKH